MKNFALTTSILFAFAGATHSACASSSQTAYDGDSTEPIQASSMIETTSKTYSASAEGDRNDSAQEVFDKAIYKAAKKTLKEDYTWFQIIDRETEKETTRTEDRPGFETRYERVPVQSCGLLGCRTTTRTYRRDTFDVGGADRVETRYAVDIEFVMGRGATPPQGDVYDAAMVKRSYR